MSEVAERTSIVRASEEGERRWFYGGGLHIWKAKAEETDGAFFLLEVRAEHGKVSPLHIHPDSDETMIVLEGEIVMHLDGVNHTVAAGGVASAPRGVPHAFRVSDPNGTRLLCLHTPGCCQDFYWDASEPVSEQGAGKPAPVDFDKVRASAQSSGGTELVGPPPFE
ncbi:MAG TPA: cupin domain-containing protein [Acidimicrobiales bacterium]|jgi:quercetin dioxygenase-like cupin family protein